MVIHQIKRKLFDNLEKKKRKIYDNLVISNEITGN